ncbi:leucine-rich repeat domain-containing protein [Lentilactobacillus sp. IMAU92037]|uniref:DUF5776 domain-containing protein n=1 Tax=Lentilactobacillus dabitei TaxID=2831523 RepID=UPI001C2BA703|nr:DUF5776 domain-containing protein [Lentilactobacillus dabitei]MBV0930015.1 leucine-rich repeat domain-containing protein [Lentilactobacillus dabitei]
MRSQKHLLAALILMCSTILLTTTVTQVTNTPVTVVAQADSTANQSISDIMPNQKLQELVLYNMKEQGLVSNSATLDTISTADFTTALGQLTSLTWDPGTSGKDQTYNNLDTVAENSNGAIEPEVNPGNYSLQGLELATNLKKIKLAANLSYGSKFYRGDITDLTPLEGLTHLEYINLSGNRITDVSPIDHQHLPNVTWLDVSGNCIANLNVLDANNYTQNFAWSDQRIVLPAITLHGNSYTWKNIFTDALPKNSTNSAVGAPYDAKNIMLARTALGYPIPGGGTYRQLEVWQNGAQGPAAPTGTQTIMGDDITFTGLAEQVVPSNATSKPWNLDLPVINNGPNTYSYYMLARYGRSNLDVIDYFLPYTIASEINYTIHPVDENGQSLNKDSSGKGYAGDKVKVPTIPGYTVNDRKVVDGQVVIPEAGGTITVVYKKNATPVNPDTPSVTPDTNPVVTPSSESTVPSKTESQPATPTKESFVGQAVYSLRKMYLYKNANFTKAARKANYSKKPRPYRPMFVVTGYRRSATGKLRYKVRDVNHASKTDGLVGYITASWNYVRPVYYQSNHKTLTVINPRGVNAYKKANLTKKVRNYKQGTVLHVTKFVHHNLTTRYVLSNGNYITGNRKLVKMGKHKMPRYIKTKKNINRYKTVNLTKRNKHIKRGTRIRIKNYDFSHANSITKTGSLRYHIAGGYITGNTKYVKVINR